MIPEKIKEQKSSTFNKSKSIQKDDPSTGLYQWEKNRQNLRAYLHSLLSIREVARSITMRCFLTDSPISLSEDEKKDIAERLELDSIRDEQKKKFNEEAEKRTKELEQHVSEFKKMVMGSGNYFSKSLILLRHQFHKLKLIKLTLFLSILFLIGGLSEVINTIQQTPDISDLPKTYQKIVEWGEIGLV
jgi:hypothetical protein